MQEEGTSTSTAGFVESFSRKYQYVMDKSSPHVLYRWIIFAVVFLLYVTRVYFLNGWFIVTYGLGIYMLNQLIGFISPQVRCNSSHALQRVCSLTYFSHSPFPLV